MARYKPHLGFEDFITKFAKDPRHKVALAGAIGSIRSTQVCSLVSLRVAICLSLHPSLLLSLGRLFFQT